MAYIKPTDRNKPWARRKVNDTRQLGDRVIKNIFRIYCEGQNTEPEYFKSFPVNTETKVEAMGLASSKKALVNKTILLLSAEKLLPGQVNYDPDQQLWVVFDFDKRGTAGEHDDFNNAIFLAQQNGIRVAYSNDAFELWFVLHFQYQNTALTRFEYYEMLSNKFNVNYIKEGKTIDFSRQMYQWLLSHQANAITYAKRLFAQKEHEPFADQNPCTTVFMLVEELNKCLKQ